MTNPMMASLVQRMLTDMMTARRRAELARQEAMMREQMRMLMGPATQLGANYGTLGPPQHMGSPDEIRRQQEAMRMLYGGGGWQ